MARSSVRRDRHDLATAMHATGRTWVEIAAALREQWPDLTVLAALRTARCWRQQDVADEWNRRWPDQPKDAKQIGLWENWSPGAGGRRPSLPALDRLAQIYQCSAADLLADVYDHRLQDPAAELGNDDASLSPSVRSDGVGLSGIGPDDALPELEPPAEFSQVSRAGHTEIDSIRALTTALANAENALGGGSVAQVGHAQIRWAVGFLNTGAPERIRRELLLSVGNLAEVVGFACFDAGDLTAAETCFRLGLWCAEQSGSWSLRACLLADLARVSLASGDADQALSATELALVRSDRLPATAKAMLHVKRARYLALLDRPDEARRAVDQGDEAMAERQPETDPAWLCYYDQAEHEGSVGRALTPIALTTGQADLAVPRLRSAITNQAPQYPRSKVFSRLRLATLLITINEPEQGAAIGLDTLQDAQRIQSHRISTELAQLHHASQRYPDLPAVTALCDQITAHRQDNDLLRTQ